MADVGICYAPLAQLNLWNCQPSVALTGIADRSRFATDLAHCVRWFAIPGTFSHLASPVRALRVL